MKTVFRIFLSFSLVFAFFSILPILSEVNAQSSRLEADVRPYVFKSTDQHYVEVFVGVLTASLKTSITDSTANKAVKVLMVLRAHDSVRYVNKYELTAPRNSEKDFYDIQRIAILPGTYNLRVELEDIHDKKSRQTKELILNVPNWNEQLAVSSIQLISEVSKAKEDNRFSKSGLIIEPLKFNFLNNNYNQLQFYFETYNTGSLLPTDYLIRYSLVKNGFRNDTLFAKYKRRKKSDIDPIIISEIFSDKWPSGDYLLNVEMMDFQRNVLSHNYTQLVISNARMEKELEEQMADSSFVSKLSEEALIYALKAVAAKVNPNDIDRLNHLIRNGSRQSRVSFIEGFWNVFSPFDPEGSYIQYMKVVRALDDMYYDGLGRGFETDRGYIYLKYGRPTNMVAVENDPTAPPYEIWFYDDFPATMQTNVKFVFYNPTLVHNKYELLHSNAKGELNNPQWLIRLYNNSPEDVIGNRVDATDVKDYWNRRAAEIFNDN